MDLTQGNSHRDVRIGALVSLALGIVFFGLCSLPSLTGPPKVDVVVRFPLSIGVEGISKGTPVVMGGVQFGSVKSVALVPADDPLQSVLELTLSIEKGIAIPRTATVAATQSIIGAGQMLVIHLPSQTGEMQLGPTDALAAAPTKSTLELLFGTDRAASLEAALETLEHFEIKPTIQDGKERLATIVNEGSSLKAQLEGDVDLWRPQAIAVLDGFDASRRCINEIDALFAEGQALDHARIAPIIDRIRSNSTECVQLIAAMRTHWNEQVVPPLSDLIDQLKRSWALAQSDYHTVDGMLNDLIAATGAAKADLQIAGHQLHSTIDEVAFMPWTLLGGAIADRSEQAQFNTVARELVRSSADLHLAVTFANDLLSRDPKLVVRHPELCELLRRWMSAAAAEQNASAQEILDRLLKAPSADPEHPQQPSSPAKE